MPLLIWWAAVVLGGWQLALENPFFMIDRVR
jgi:hypothetical protein